MKLSERQLFFLYRCLLAQWFTCPSLPLPRPLPPHEAMALQKRGLWKWMPGARITESGLAELALAGVDTRTAKTASESWKARAAKVTK